ncbi:MFS transporter [Planotetraspora kaengkrachanensis]|uniref:Putative major facilitator superfamily protein n=1 Tax=Planotetraspora kaengkrachanensis TaxID=575193 RepID=A0A8J3PUT5_9ACTN|nr:MFS transporter [Planotetraspora kaengkrachanensis]GIG81458.1 putative major facilitator superfamily protein [Planotetraspora kaengkrachanensis]
MRDAEGSMDASKTSTGSGPARRAGRLDRDHPRYKWVALSNTTVGMLLATVNSSIVIISLPAIFRGIGLNPLEPGNVSFLLWMIMGFLLVSAVLVVPAGRLGDMYGRVRIYNAGFAVFTVASIALSLDPLHGGSGALWLIGWRVVQGVGGAMLFANSTAILTDAFPVEQRGTALGVNQVAAIAGSFLGLIIGGLLAEWDWRVVFLVSVPIGLVGTIWSYASLHELGERRPGRLDLPGNITFAAGLGVVLAAITYGIQPYGGHSTGWENPWVLGGIAGGVLLLAVFCVIERRAAEPMFQLSLFRIPQFSAGSLAVLLSAIGRGGLQFMLIIWLQGIWLPLHGFAFEETPLWAGIYMLPLTVGFLAAGPVSGYLSDRYGQRLFASGGLIIVAAAFLGLMALPVDFPYWVFAALLAISGIGSGVFSSPNTSRVMSSVPAHQRGAAAGMRGTFQNSGQALSIGVFFSLLIIGLAAGLPNALTSGLERSGVPAAVAQSIGHLPPVGSLFAAFLGYNPIRTILPPDVLSALPPDTQARLTGNEFFPNLISAPVHQGLVVVFSAAAVMMVIGAIASLLDGRRRTTT